MLKLLSIQDSKDPAIYQYTCINNVCFSLIVYVSVLYTPFLIIHRQPSSVAGESSKTELAWMIVAVFTFLLAMIGAGATIICSLMYFKKLGSTSKMSLKPSAVLGEQGSKTCIGRGKSVENLLPHS